MAEFFDGLFNSETADTISGYVLIFGTGLFLYIMNIGILINNRNPKKKWVSMAPPLGGLLIAVGILIAGGGWWALLGLTDPSILVFVYSIIKGRAPDKKRTNTEKENDENGGSDENDKSDK